VRATVSATLRVFVYDLEYGRRSIWGACEGPVDDDNVESSGSVVLGVGDGSRESRMLATGDMPIGLIESVCELDRVNFAGIMLIAWEFLEADCLDRLGARSGRYDRTGLRWDSGRG
jgi:hypothetical protein